MRKKRPPEHENHERWLVSYADFITLLFAFFVVMFAVSKVDAQKVGRFVESVQVAFEYRGVFPNSSPHPIEGSSAGATTIARPSIAPMRVRVADSRGLSRRGAELRTTLEKLIAGSNLAGRVRVRTEKRGIVVSLTEACFFDVGSAAVRQDALSTLHEIGTVLQEAEADVVVEGHTDSTPIRTALFPSNWELSTTRATTILAYLINQLGYDPTRLSAAGYGQYRPVADNATAEGRAQNRRVDVVVLTESI